ncbi:hypothetical protein [Campylobacter suis]|uniref:Lycopene cyclase domain-containing protein n=1 Tax=Campylobacter suis TaxID=2790657 RepID=A0ABN7KAD4_9BACT|nr:hypothetical protein [Campylobacter suis]CAD7289468.1 hypothetical protein LMG8286_01822 [Campylobacter suis]
MEFLVLSLIFISAFLLLFKPEKRALATGLAIASAVISILMEFYVNLWVVVPIGNY